MGINECSKPASKSSWDSQDFGDVNMVLKMVHFHKSSRPQWVNLPSHSIKFLPFPSLCFVEPQYAICVVFTTRLYYKCLKIHFVQSDMANNPQ